MKLGRKLLYPSVIEPRMEEICEWISEGIPEYEIMRKIGVSNDVWYKAKNAFPKFKEAILHARGHAGELLLGKQFSAACGQVIPLRKDKVLKDGSVVEAIEEVYIPPSVPSADFWGRHMMPGYIAPRAEGGAVTIQVSLPTVESEIKKLSDERERLEEELKSIELDGSAYTVDMTSDEEPEKQA